MVHEGDVAAPSAHRRDLEGMRAVAVVLVVAYHAHVPGFRAGFVGVDVFFVLSGFLITRLILNEIARTGSVDLPAFWARRARRLLPAANLVLVVSLTLSVVLLSPFALRVAATDIEAAALYVSNIRFAGREADYFGRAVSSSPVLHMWSLAVEEQFYLAWPILFAIGVRFGGDPKRRSRLVVSGLVILVGVSFAVSFALSFGGSPWGFYGAPSRAWELGSGGLLAAASAYGWSPSRGVRLGALWLGFACIAVALASIDDRGPYPGVAALWPALGAVFIIASNASADKSVLARCLASGPLQWTGRVSYSWYLWHWPAIVFAECVLPPGMVTRLAAVAAALLLATFTHVLVENKVRFHPLLVQSGRGTFAVAAGSTMICVVAALGALRLSDQSASVAMRAIRAAASDSEGLETKDCAAADVRTLSERCAFGGPGPVKVLLIGDSHARQWSPALDEIGRKQGWRGVFFGMGDCPAVLVRVARSTARENIFVACDKWHADLRRVIAEIGPSVVVVGSSSAYVPLQWVLAQDGRRLSLEEQIQEWQSGVGRLADMLRGAGVSFVYLLDTARLPSHPLDCLATAPNDELCAAPLEGSLALGGRVRGLEESALRAGRIPTFDPVPRMCDATRCTPKRGDIFVYRDDNHITATFARSVSAELAGVISIANPHVADK